jgi:capsular exopolysaccharide synthesis family protein
VDAPNLTHERPPEGDLDLVRYWHIVLKQRWLIVAFFVMVLVLDLVWTLHQTKIYEAVASIDIEQTTPQVLGSNVQDVVDTGPGYWFAKEYYETQYKVITSRAVSQKVIDRLGLADSASREKAPRSSSAVAALQAKIRVEGLKDSHLVYIRAQDSDPQQAAILANAVAQAYIDQTADQRVEATRNAADWLQGQAGDLKTKLEGSELALYQYKHDQNMLSMSLEDQQNTTSQKLKTLSDEITRVQTKKVGLQAQVAQIREIQNDAEKNGGFRAESFLPVVQSPLIQALKQVYFKQEQEVAQLQQRYEPQHPKLVAAQRELQISRSQLQREMDDIVSASEAEYRQAVETEASLVKLLEKVRTEAFEINKKEIDYRKLEREATNNQRLYDMVLKRLKETDLSVLLKTNNVHLLDAAVVPRVPVKPNLKTNSVLGMILGLLGGLLLAFLVETLDNTLKGQDDIERTLGLPFLGILPSIHDASVPSGVSQQADTLRDLFVHTNPKSSVAECCRSIRTNLLFMSPDHPLRKLLVASSGPKEGKTTTAVSLGIAMAQSGSRTLLVDTDMRRPRLHRAFQISNEVGLSSAVVGEAPIEDCIKNTGIPNLWVLPCGPVPPNPAEMLHADRFRQILAQLDQQFDRIVFDSPPLVAVADAAVLSTQVDGCLMVVKAGKTTRELALRAMSSLVSVNARIIGVILNDLDLDALGYGYYYYYRRGGYYGEEQGSRAAAG